MPPKTKTKKPRAVVNGTATEMSKDELWEQAVQLQQELDRVRKEKNYFQLEKDKTVASWEVSKRKLQEAEYELRNRRREIEEDHQHSQVQITKLKHVLAEENNAISKRKIDGVSSSSLIQDQHRESELALHAVAQGWQADYEQKKLHKQNYIKELLLKNQLELIEMNKDYERRLQEMHVNYNQKMQSLIEAKEKERNRTASKIDKQMKSHVASLIRNHDIVLEKAKAEYNKVEMDQKKKMTLLKNDLERLGKVEPRMRKMLSAAQAENKCLRETLHEAQQELTELKKQLQDPRLTRDAFERHRACLKSLDKQILEMTVKNEQMQQAVEKEQREQDELVMRQTERMVDIQQKSGLQKMLLEKKLAVQAETLEVTEVQLYAALSVSSQDLTTRSNAAKKLEEMMNSKQAIVNTMEEDLARQCKEYDDLRHSCMKRLRDKGISLHDFSFKPSKQILKEVTPNI